MKQLLLLTAVSALAFPTIKAENAAPVSIPDARIVSVSTNGNLAVSMGVVNGMQIIDLTPAKTGGEASVYVYKEYTPGHTRSASDVGIVVGVTELGAPQYWKDGEWYDLPLTPEVVNSNMANSITPDGRRICGSLGVAPMSYDDDALMQVPCIWTAEGDGYGIPVVLPHPDRDFSGRVPQYITALDISADGKTVVGQVRDAVGMVHYPIVYREDENGEWSYELPHLDLLNPNGIEIPAYPGNGPVQPSQENFMTPSEIEAYIDALMEYYESGYTQPYPKYEDFMTQEEIDAYNQAAAEYDSLYERWYEAYERWAVAYEEIRDTAPGLVFNSVMISADGKYFGCSVEIPDYSRPNGWMGYAVDYNTWVYAIDSDDITKYKGADINLSAMCNDGVAIASTSVGTPNKSFVLKDGNVTPMLDWMKAHDPEYAAWMEENMVYVYESYNWETDEMECFEELLSGFAVATPDLSEIILSVENMTDYMDDGEAFVFDMNVGSGVQTVGSASVEQTIYDLSGRRLKEVSAPGIYIINGEKKVVR